MNHALIRRSDFLSSFCRPRYGVEEEHELCPGWWRFGRRGDSVVLPCMCECGCNAKAPLRWVSPLPRSH